MEKLRAVLAGCGSMSKGWLKAITTMDDLELAGLVDIIGDAAIARKDEFGLVNAETGSDLDAMLKRLKPDIVFDVTVPETHTANTLTALRHGCHVLGEKPMATSMEDARRMVEASQRSGKTYAVMQNRRHARPIRRVRKVIESGALGDLTTVNCDFYIGAHFGGFRDHMPHVLLVDMAIHTFDMARYASGADPVAVDFCKEWNPRGSWYDRDASAIVVFEMSNGIVFTYRGSWCSEGMHTSWESDWRFAGSKGSARWDGNEQFQAQVVAQTGGFISTFDEVALPEMNTAGYESGHDSLIRDFVRCVQEGRTPETACADNIKSLAMVFGAIESAETGRPVTIGI